MFRLVPSTAKPSDSGMEVTFQFRNESTRVVKLSGYFGLGPKDGVLEVGYTGYEVQVRGKWEPLDVGYDTIPEYYPVEPGGELRLLISLSPFKVKNIPGIR